MRAARACRPCPHIRAAQDRASRCGCRSGPAASRAATAAAARARPGCGCSPARSACRSPRARPPRRAGARRRPRVPSPARSADRAQPSDGRAAGRTQYEIVSTSSRRLRCTTCATSSAASSTAPASMYCPTRGSCAGADFAPRLASTAACCEAGPSSSSAPTGVATVAVAPGASTCLLQSRRPRQRRRAPRLPAAPPRTRASGCHCSRAPRRRRCRRASGPAMSCCGSPQPAAARPSTPTHRRWDRWRPAAVRCRDRSRPGSARND